MENFDELSVKFFMIVHLSFIYIFIPKASIIIPIYKQKNAVALREEATASCSYIFVLTIRYRYL